MAAQDTDSIYVSLLGPIRVWLRGELVGPAGAKRRGLLALLALDANRPVPAEALIEGLWGDDPPSSATNLVQTYISVWRRALEPGRAAGRPGRRLRTLGATYELQLGSEESDILRFEAAAAAGARHADAGRFGSAAAELGHALESWDGPVLVDVRELPFAVDTVRRLEQRRVAVAEQWAHACLQGRVGAPGVVADALEQLRRTDPLRERLVELQMWALCRDGYPAKALELFDQARRTLAAQLGTDPGSGLRAMHAEVLADAARLRPAQARLIEAQNAARATVPPPRGDSFVGRERAVADVTALVRAHRMVTLTGPGGAGKSRLAEEVARASNATALVELAGLDDAAAVPATLAGALGLRLGTDEDALAALIEVLADAECLVVLDNLEHLQGVAQIVERLVRATGRLRILATSRHPLGVAAEHRYPVPPLTLPSIGAADPARLVESAAIRLLVDRAVAVGAPLVVDARTAPRLAELVTGLDGLPLAIEIAAPWLRVLSPGQLLNRLGELQAFAHERVAGSGRHRTLDAVVDWSVRLLPDEVRRLLYRLSVFRGSASLPAVEIVCGHDLEEPTLALLGALVDHSLALPVPVFDDRPPRFRLLETVRQYLVRHYARTPDHRDTERRYLDWFADWTAAFAAHSEGPDSRQWLEDATADLHNLRATLDAAIGTSRELRLVANCSGVWHALGQLREGLQRLERALATAAPTDPARTIATADLAWLLLSSDVDRASQLARDALDRAERTGDPLLLSWALQVAGYAHQDHTAATATLLAAIDAAEGARGLPVRYAQTGPEAVRSGAAHGLMQRLVFRDANATVAICEAEARRAVDDSTRAHFTIHLGLALMRAGRVDEAAQLPPVDPLYLTAADRFNAALLDGLLDFHAGRSGDAATYFDQGWELAKQRGSLFHVAIAASWIVNLAVDTAAIGDGTALEDATRIVTEAQERCRSTDARIRAIVDVSRARLHRVASERTSCEALLERSAHVAAGDELRPDTLVWFIESAACAAERGDLGSCDARLTEARTRSASTGLVIPPWEERRIAEVVDRRHNRRGLRAV